MTQLPLLLLILLTFSCERKTVDAPIEKRAVVAANKNIRAAALYDALLFVISDQKLDRRLGMKPAPIQLSDHVLSQRLIDTLETSSVSRWDVGEDGKLVPNESFKFSIYPRQVLTPDDIDFMLHQQRAYKDLYWDNARLGFNTSNTSEWYEFSIPLFSRDSSKVVMEIHWSCDKFMCRHDTPILLTKTDRHWTADIGPTVFH